MTWTTDSLLTLISCGISLFAVCVSAYAVWETKQTQLNAAYFSEMTTAYSQYLGSVCDFVFRRDSASRDKLAADLYKLELFATEKIMRDAQALYLELLEWSQRGCATQFPLDPKTHSLAEEMRAHLETFRHRSAGQ